MNYNPLVMVAGSLPLPLAAFVQAETGSTFDVTVYKGVTAPGAHPPPTSEAPDDEAFSVRRKVEKPTPTSEPHSNMRA